MLFEAILREVDHLHNVSTRLEALAEQHVPITEALMTAAGSVCNTAAILAVLVAATLPIRCPSSTLLVRVAYGPADYPSM